MCEMYHVYCCIQGDPDDTAPNVPLPVFGPETEEKEEEVSAQCVQCSCVCYIVCAMYHVYIL